jgi:hypothetical protein
LQSFAACKLLIERCVTVKLARAIGLIQDDGGWQPWHRQQIATILVIVAAVEREAGPTGTRPIDFERIVNETEPGAGVLRTSRIVRSESRRQRLRRPDR